MTRLPTERVRALRASLAHPPCEGRGCFDEDGAPTCTGLVEGASAELVRCVDALLDAREELARQAGELARLRAENERLAQRCEWFRAAHMLVASERAFVAIDKASPFFVPSLGGRGVAGLDVIQGEPVLWIACSDSFAWACADAEKAEYADAPALLRVGVNEGWPGLLRWVQSRRVARSEPAEMIPPVAERVRGMDDLRAENARLRAMHASERDSADDCAGDRASLAREVDRLRAIVEGRAANPLRERAADLIGDLQRRSDVCRHAARGEASDATAARLGGKAQAYEHAADMLTAAVTDTDAADAALREG